MGIVTANCSDLAKQNWKVVMLTTTEDKRITTGKTNLWWHMDCSRRGHAISPNGEILIVTKYSNIATATERGHAHFTFKAMGYF